MHRFIALRVLKSSDGDLQPGSFFPDLEAAPHGTQAMLVRRCGVLDLSGVIKMDKFDRFGVRRQAALIADLKAVDIDVEKLIAKYAKANGIKDETFHVERVAKPKAEKKAPVAKKTKAKVAPAVERVKKAAKGKGRK